MTHTSHNATSHNATSNRNEENTMINQDAKTNAITAAIAAANARSAERYRVANEFPALGDCMATYHATEADANEAAAGLIASLADDIMAWGELTPVAPTGDAAEVAAMREAYDLAASASDDAINNAGIVRMTREAAELIAARAVSITRVNA